MHKWQRQCFADDARRLAKAIELENWTRVGHLLDVLTQRYERHEDEVQRETLARLADMMARR